MPEFSFENANKDFSKRSRGSLTTNIIISILFGTIITLFSNILWGIGISLVFFAIQSYKSNRWDKIFIYKITIDDEITIIEYSEHNQIKTLIDHTNKFFFKKEITISKIRTAYLAIYQDNHLKIKQFEIDNIWTENKMDEIITSHLRKTV